MPCCFLSFLSSPATLNTANSDPIWSPSPLPVWAFQFHAAFPHLKLMLPMSVLSLHNFGTLWILCSHQLQHVSYLQQSSMLRSCVSSAIMKLFTSFAPPSECAHFAEDTFLPRLLALLLFSEVHEIFLPIHKCGFHCHIDAAVYRFSSPTQTCPHAQSL